MEIWVVLGIIAAVAIVFITIYNRLVALKQKRSNAFSDIDVQLQQRYDLIPNLVNTVKGYAEHEKTILENVTEARASVGQARGAGAERIEAENMLSRSLMNLFAVAENYPDLKADANFRQLQSELADIENKISAARRFFNSATSEYNTAIQQFPANMIAAKFGFYEEPFFEIEEAMAEEVKKTPEVKF